VCACINIYIQERQIDVDEERASNVVDVDMNSITANNSVEIKAAHTVVVEVEMNEALKEQTQHLTSADQGFKAVSAEIFTYIHSGNSVPHKDERRQREKQRNLPVIKIKTYDTAVVPVLLCV
jgi:hypothetical protein